MKKKTNGFVEVKLTDKEKTIKEKPIVSENKQGLENLKGDINSIMENFEKTKSKFSADNNIQPNVANTEVITNDLTFGTPEVAVKIVLRIGNFILTHLNVTILNMFTKFKLDSNELKLTDEELEELSDYAEPVAAELIKVLPDWCIMLIHIEGIYIDKFIELSKKKEKEEKAKPKEIKVEIETPKEKNK